MSKYRNKRVTLNHGGKELKFDSQAEAKRFLHLNMVAKTVGITDLELQPEYQLCEPFVRNGKHYRAIIYRADFRYKQSGQVIVEDVKGMKTDVYQMKKKMFLREYGEGLRFLEVTYKNNRFAEVEL